MKNLRGSSIEEANKVARRELQKMGIPYFESDFMSMVGSTVFGAVQFKRGRKVLTLQRWSDCWILRINAVFRSSEQSRLDSYAHRSHKTMPFRRKAECRIVIQQWWVANQRKLIRLVNALKRYYGGIVEMTVDADELYEKRLLSDYSPA